LEGQPSTDGLAGRRGHDPEGGSLGGVRSPRPHSKAGRKPRHNMIIGNKGTPGGLGGTRSGEAKGVITGVRSPPLRGMAERCEEGLTGAKPG
jgi:hypothetical protein